MGIFGQILLGLFMIAIGIVLLMKNYQVTNSMPLHFFEQKLGSGSSYMIWKILSIMLIFVGFTVMFGFYDEVLTWMLSPLTNLISGNKEQ